MTTKTYTNFSSSIPSISLLDFRKDLGKVLESNNNPLEIVKRGKTMGLVLPVELGNDFLAWYKKNQIKQKYLSQKNGLTKAGNKTLLEADIIKNTRGLSKASPDQIVNLISKI